MKYYTIGFIEDGYSWYLCMSLPGKSIPGTVMGIQLATRFPSKEDAVKAMKEYLNGKKLIAVFTNETTFFSMS